MATKTSRGRATGRSAAKRKQKKPSLIQRTTRALRGVPGRVGHHLGEHTADVWGIVLIALGALVFLSFFDLSGPIGASASSWNRRAGSGH